MSKISADDPLVQTGLFGDPIAGPPKQGMRRDFIYPPFSVLNAREGWWQERKREWLALGIMSEVGRGGAGRRQADDERYDPAPEAERGSGAEACAGDGR